ncbi:transposase [Clostridium frigidicarnis]|uniref:transposase n=1 Tax=Clostridium frigidicarnis TaxID=84698 RepID=UPI000B7F95D5|nr:transposase [Clostridium frigidicarnis]
MSLLCTHPEVGFINAVSLLAKIGDITNFKNAKKLVAFVGVNSSVSWSGHSHQSNLYIKLQLD